MNLRSLIIRLVSRTCLAHCARAAYQRAFFVFFASTHYGRNKSFPRGGAENIYPPIFWHPPLEALCAAMDVPRPTRPRISPGRTRTTHGSSQFPDPNARPHAPRILCGLAEASPNLLQPSPSHAGNTPDLRHAGSRLSPKSDAAVPSTRVSRSHRVGRSRHQNLHPPTPQKATPAIGTVLPAKPACSPPLCRKERAAP